MTGGCGGGHGLSYLSKRKSEVKMTDDKSWDEIPSLNLELDDSDDGEETDERSSPRTERQGLMRLIPNHMDLPIKIVTTNRREIEGTILNLSRGGIKLKASQLLEQSQLVQVEFTLNEKKIDAHAEVCWVSPHERTAAMPG